MQKISFITSALNMTARLAMVFCLILSLIPSHRVSAAEPNQLFVTPPSSQMSINTQFDVNIRSYADSSETVGTAKGTVTYPASKLKVVGISTSGSAYSFTPGPQFYIKQGSGKIDFSGTRSDALSGSAQIFKITFKATGAGTASVSFATGGTVNQGATILKNGVFTITSPKPSSTPKTPPKPSSTPKPSPVPIQTTPPTPTPTESNVPITTPDPTGLVSNIIVSPQYATATVNWTVNTTNASSTFVYGTSTSQLDKKATVTKKSDGTFETKVTGLSPGTRYIFLVTAKGKDGKTGSYTSTIFTRGYPVTIKVTENGIPVTKGQIRIGTVTSPINSNGTATIGLASGSYSGTITTDTASLTINLTVAAKTIPTDGTAPEAQQESFNLTSSPLSQGPGSGTSIVTFLVVLGIGSVLLGIGFVGFIAYRKRKFEYDSDSVSYSSSTGPAVVIDDGYKWQQDPQDHSPTPTSPPPVAATPQQRNSVYLDEEEPLDMFEQAEKNLPLPPDPNQPTETFENEQNSNPPRSTMP